MFTAPGWTLFVAEQRKKDWPGFTLPGGHVEPNESIVEAVVREMKEETGLQFKKEKL